MNLKKHAQPLGLGFVVLALATGALYDNSRHRFGAARDEAGLASGGNAAFLSKLEWTWYDLKFKFIDRFKTRGDTVAKGVLVAKIDDASLQKFGRWPWSRGIYGDLLSYLYELGAEVVAFDAVFSEPEFKEKFMTKYMQMKPENKPASIQDKLKLSTPEVQGLSKDISEIGTQIFGSAVLRLPKTVLGYIWEGQSACHLYNPADKDAPKNDEGVPFDVDEAGDKGMLHVKRFADDLSALEKHGISIDGIPPLEGKGESPVLVGFCPTVSRAAISANAKYQGVFSAIADSDGLFRRIPLVVGFVGASIKEIPEDDRAFLPEDWAKKGTFFPSLALQAVAAYYDELDPNSNQPKYISKPQLETHRTSQGAHVIDAVIVPRGAGKDPLRIRTLPDGTVPVNFYGSQGVSHPPIGEFSLGQISTELFDKDFQQRYDLDIAKPLRNKIVIIGPTALGVSDLRPNPVQGDAAGVYIHATMAARLLAATDKADAAQSKVAFAGFAWNAGILWVLGIMLASWVVNVRSISGVSGTLGVVLAFLAADFVVFSEKALSLDAMTTTLALSGLFLAIFAYKYFTEEKDRAFVKGAFEKYVSPDLVDQIMADPKKLNLGGKKAELSVLFSDVRGFTTISEKMDAAGLARFMNEYLSPMTDIVQANKGTIDKYMGDAIMAIFGAPIEYPEHAERAVDGALAMLEKLPELVKEWAARGLPPIDIGVGINTGEMSVGNMGSSKIFSYTVMGDAVNLGSRLEGINKEYGTNLIVSEFTRAKLPPEYLCRELDRVKVKGKKLPVTIFEVMGKGNLPQKAAIRDRFEEGLKLYYDRKFADAKRIFESQAETDKTSKIYLERCDYWTEHAPEADWDGSWTMKTK